MSHQKLPRREKGLLIFDGAARWRGVVAGPIRRKGNVHFTDSTRIRRTDGVSEAMMDRAAATTNNLVTDPYRGENSTTIRFIHCQFPMAAELPGYA
ncbi:hypothetical protein [Mesorhizobium sp. RMAD-H1]|uniref:hypothetical protein n=1 Tax=Mesorhizobium sp. RMAD-H1 TaxID=2587065 RepID=UPI00160B7E88|nr:hypothetical protein [Mesorhizobium sp. RMAD-H1]